MEGLEGVGDISSVGVGMFLVWQLARLVARLQGFLDSMAEHNAAVEEKLDRMIEAIGHASGVPRDVKPQPTPVRDVGNSERNRSP